MMMKDNDLADMKTAVSNTAPSLHHHCTVTAPSLQVSSAISKGIAAARRATGLVSVTEDTEDGAKAVTAVSDLKWTGELFGKVCDGVGVIGTVVGIVLDGMDAAKVL